MCIQGSFFVVFAGMGKVNLVPRLFMAHGKSLVKRVFNYGSQYKYLTSRAYLSRAV